MIDSDTLTTEVQHTEALDSQSTHASATDSNIPVPDNDPETIYQALLAHYTMQRTAFDVHPYESREERLEHLSNLKRLLSENRDAIAEAINKDYGNRAYHETMLAELIVAMDDIGHTKKALKKWMKVQRRKIDYAMYFGGSNKVVPQPLGVVGLIIPWNFPINLSFIGLAAAFAAGNRAMVKMSENSLALTDLLIEITPKYFAADKLQFFKETGIVGQQFSRVPFDHLMFTGSGATGRKVMANAAANLTPVTLELGGKSPAVIDPNYDFNKAVERIMFAKQYNAGQICTNVDYVFVHEKQKEAFVVAAKEWVAKHVPDINSKDYTSLIDMRAFQRMEATVADAAEKGARIEVLNHQEPNSELRKYPLTLMLDTTADMIIENRETFGPILMVKTYREPQEVIDYILSHDRPLAFYPFSKDNKLVDMYIEKVMSGGVTVNDAIFHVGQNDLPFGGVGPSGMGHYHGYEGFLTFSKLRPIFKQANISSLKLLAPPYGKLADKVINILLKLKG
ncbi:coniferyl aldehyde dehydrogenase [Alteromonas sp. LMIT006]|uniref:coniferyl aldehyde dehydrogenase n=1 Tax=Alteromonadaceae TaxID=72275 RepID=UPI0020CA6FDA|nr:coniferyl aldehyde dehydrogenase [Alteromonas sp. LMIT006]UTP72701.1 coniferyl aldehyde dehydrogenase [Alteromonas sp. LMIT006]